MASEQGTAGFCQWCQKLLRSEMLTWTWLGSKGRGMDHVLVFREAGLRQTLKQYFAYYERYRTHLSLKKDAPVGRPVEPPSLGEVIQIPQVGGLHHLYTRKAA